MRNKKYILVILILFAAVLSPGVHAEDSQLATERKIKAAFLYNFINFVQWPESVMGDKKSPVVIGVVGSRNSTKEFLKIVSKKVKNKKIEVRQFDEFCNVAKNKKNCRDKKRLDLIEKSLKKCQVVFIADCESLSSNDVLYVLNNLKGTPVLTVGEEKEFLKMGGIINFLTGQKIQFEINLDAASKNSLKIRSKLLKLAKRIIKEKKAGGEIKKL